jgi:hypothetical protein
LFFKGHDKSGFYAAAVNSSMKPNFFITKKNFEQLIGPGFWKIQDIPALRAQQIRPFLGSQDTLAVFASGLAPRQLNHISEELIGGIDWVRLESSPKDKEPPLNVYHYVIGKETENGYPVYGPYKDGSIAGHWSCLKDLDIYQQ